jgi:hypothetical protein
MSTLWRTIRSYILWNHERGSVQYDIMVTLILIFVFLSPQLIDFKDKPAERTPHQTGVAVQPDGAGGFIYQVEAAAVEGREEADIRADLLRVIEPIAGGVDVVRYEVERDAHGHPVKYVVWVRRH